MPARRLLQPRNSDRVIPLVFSCWFLYAAIWLELINHDTHEFDAFYAWMWPWVFAAAGVLGIAYAARPHSRLLFAWSGGLMIGALVSRAFSLLAAWLTGQITLSTPRTWLSGGAWMLLAYSVGTIWSRFLAPISAARRNA